MRREGQTAPRPEPAPAGTAAPNLPPSGKTTRATLGLAPMAGITDWPMRLLSYRMGAGYACTEMVSAVGYLCAKPGNPAYARLLEVHPQEPGTACQLFGKDPAAMGEAAARITALGRFTSLDINMGCPARKVTSSGEGSALLKNPDLAFRIMEAVKANTYLPVTLKTRLGFDRESLHAALLAQAAAGLGFQWICVHGRTREQGYGGRADYRAIRAIREAASLPVIANGDVFTPGDAVRILAETGCPGLMIGRGAMGNPALFRAARQALDGLPVSPPSPGERIRLAIRHIELMAGFKGETLGVLEMRKHLGHYVSGLQGAASIRRALNQARSAAQQTALLQGLLEREEAHE
ncbi:MAG: tRNA dihydrouridine synthase DusB [Clostridia bacterium]|nr:tRNA dihydrouridine synthase DusB [Clostridia bacterium]